MLSIIKIGLEPSLIRLARYSATCVTTKNTRQKTTPNNSAIRHKPCDIQCRLFFYVFNLLEIIIAHLSAECKYKYSKLE